MALEIRLWNYDVLPTSMHIHVLEKVGEDAQVYKLAFIFSIGLCRTGPRSSIFRAFSRAIIY